MALMAVGVEMVGRLAGIRDGRAQISGSLRNKCDLADLKLGRLLDTLDEWATANGVEDSVPPPHRFAPTVVPEPPRLDVDLTDGRIRTIIWATGFRPDYSWLDVPVWDGHQVHHTRGRTPAPGVWFIGLPWQHTRGSALLGFVGDDAGWVANGVVERHRAAQGAI